MLDPSDAVAFDIYFASVTSMQYHPGASTKEHKKLSVHECADIALSMVEVRRKLLNKEE